MKTSRYMKKPGMLSARLTTLRFARLCRQRYVSSAARNAITLILLFVVVIFEAGVARSEPLDDFFITVTSDDVYLCGEGFGGMYGCIDEAVSREAKSVVISASSNASVESVQELVNAVHRIGFDLVGFATFDEDDE